MQGKLKAVEYLMEEMDAKPGVEDARGRRPIDLARMKAQWHVVDYLLKRTVRDRWTRWCCPSGQTPLVFLVLNLASVVTIGYPLYVFPLLVRTGQVSLMFISTHLMLQIVNWTSLYLSWSTSPGYIETCTKSHQHFPSTRSDHPDHALEYQTLMERLARQGSTLELEVGINAYRPLCHTCHIQRPLRSKHCHVCKRCVLEFDHQYV